MGGGKGGNEGGVKNLLNRFIFLLLRFEPLTGGDGGLEIWNCLALVCWSGDKSEEET